MRQLAILALAAAGAIGTAHAQPPLPLDGTRSPLSSCLTDHSNGKDRKDLARWMFVVMGQHPAINDLSAVTPATRDDTTRAVGALVTRLLTQDCAAEVRTAMEGGEGQQVFGQAFAQLGQVAMQEIMTDPTVNKGLQDLPRFLDRKKFEDVFRKK